MRHLHFAACALMFVPCLSAAAQEADKADPDAAVIDQLFTVARQPGKLLPRLAAIDALGKLAAKDAAKIHGYLQQLLVAPKEWVPTYDSNVFRLATVNAIANLGYNGRDLLPALATAKGDDRTLDAAIDTAMAKILATKPPEKAAAPKPAGPPRHEDDIKKQLAKLKSNPDPGVPLGASAKVQEYVKEGNADDLTQIIQGLLPLFAGKAADPVSQVLAAKLALPALDAAKTRDNYAGWRKSFVTGIAGLLDVAAKNTPDQRLEAITALGGLTPHLSAGDADAAQDKKTALTALKSLRDCMDVTVAPPNVKMEAQAAMNRLSAGK